MSGIERRHRTFFLEHKIGTFAIFIHLKVYHTYPVPEVENSSTSDDQWHHCYIKVTSLCFVESQRIQETLGPFTEYEVIFNDKQEKHPLFV